MTDDGWNQPTPGRWVHPELGAVQDVPERATVRVEPRCTHDYGALSVPDGRRMLKGFGGLCYSCWSKARKSG